MWGHLRPPQQLLTPYPEGGSWRESERQTAKCSSSLQRMQWGYPSQRWDRRSLRRQRRQCGDTRQSWYRRECGEHHHQVHLLLTCCSNSASEALRCFKRNRCLLPTLGTRETGVRAGGPIKGHVSAGRAELSVVLPVAVVAFGTGGDISVFALCACSAAGASRGALSKGGVAYRAVSRGGGSRRAHLPLGA